MDAGLQILLDELQSEGTTDSAGAFTMDLGQALAKLRHYQLAGPRAYLLPLVACAVLGGASFFRAEGTSDRLSLTFDGQPFTASQLRPIFSHLLLAERVSRLKELAVALNSLLGADYQSIEVSSWDEEAGAELRLSGETVTVRTLSNRPRGNPCNQVTLVRKTGLMGRVLKGLRPLQAERSYLAERCALAPLELSVAEETVRGHLDFSGALAVAGLVDEGCPLRLEFPELPVRRASLSPGAFSALLCLTPETSEWSELTFVVHGIRFLRRVRLPLAGARGVVACNELRKNLSHTDLVEDENYHRIISQIGYESLLLAAFLGQRLDRLPAQQLGPARRMLRNTLGSFVKASSWKTTPAALEPLLDAPAFLLSNEAPVSLRAWLEQYDQVGYLPYSREVSSAGLVDGELTALLSDEQVEVLETIFPELSDRTSRVSGESDDPKDWLLEGLPAHNYLLKLALSELKGEIGVRKSGIPEPARLLFVRGAFYLGQREAEELPAGLDILVQADRLGPDQLTSPQALNKLRAAIAEDLALVYEKVARLGDVPMGNTRQVARNHLCNYLGWLPPHCPGALPGEALGPETTYIELFTSLRGASLCLKEVLEEVESRGCVAVVDGDDHAGSRRSGQLPDYLTLVLDPHEQRALIHFLGHDRVKSARALLALLRSRPAFFARSVNAPILRDGVVWRHAFRVDGMQGEVGVPTDRKGSKLEARALFHGRLLDTWEQQLGFGPVEAVVRCDELTPSAGWNSAVNDAVWQKVKATVVSQARHLALVVSAALDSPDASRAYTARKFIWGQLCSELRRFASDPEQVACEPLFRELSRLPVFPDLWGKDRDLRSLMPHTRTVRLVGYVGRRVPLDPDPERVVLLLKPDEVRVLAEALRLMDVVDLEEELRLGTQARGGHPALLPPGAYLARSPATPLEGEIGLVSGVGPSVIKVLCRHHPLTTLEVDTPIPFQATVNHDGAAASQRVREALPEHLEVLSRRLLDGILNQREHRLFLLELAVRVSRRGDSRELRARLWAHPTVRDLVSARLITLDSLGEHSLFVPADALEAAQARAAQQVARDRNLQRLPVLGQKEQELLFELVTLQPVDRGFVKAVRAAHNRSRPRLTSYRLEEHFPGRRWLARIPVTGEGLLGEVGLPAVAEPGLCLITVDRLELRRLPLPDPGLLGVVDGRFTANEEWTGLADPKELEPLVAQVEAEVAAALGHRLAEIAEDDRPRALRAMATLRSRSPVARSLPAEPPPPPEALRLEGTQQLLTRALGNLIPGEAPELVLANLGHKASLVSRRDGSLVLNTGHPTLRRLPDAGRVGLQLLALLLAQEHLAGQPARERHQGLLKALLP